MDLKPIPLGYNDGGLRLYITDVAIDFGFRNKNKLIMFPLDISTFGGKGRVTWALRHPLTSDTEGKWVKIISLVENRSSKYKSYFIRIPKLIEKTMLWKKGQNCLVGTMEPFSSNKLIVIVNQNAEPVDITEELKLEAFRRNAELYEYREQLKPAAAITIALNIEKQYTERGSLPFDEYIKLIKTSKEQSQLLHWFSLISPKTDESRRRLSEELPEYLENFKKWKVLRAKVINEKATKTERMKYRALYKKLRKTSIWKLLHDPPKEALINDRKHT